MGTIQDSTVDDAKKANGSISFWCFVVGVLCFARVIFFKFFGF